MTWIVFLYTVVCIATSKVSKCKVVWYQTAAYKHTLMLLPEFRLLSQLFLQFLIIPIMMRQGFAGHSGDITMPIPIYSYTVNFAAVYNEYVWCMLPTVQLHLPPYININWVYGDFTRIRKCGYWSIRKARGDYKNRLRDCVMEATVQVPEDFEEAEKCFLGTQLIMEITWMELA